MVRLMLRKMMIRSTMTTIVKKMVRINIINNDNDEYDVNDDNDVAADGVDDDEVPW